MDTEYSKCVRRRCTIQRVPESCCAECHAQRVQVAKELFEASGLPLIVHEVYKRHSVSDMKIRTQTNCHKPIGDVKFWTNGWTPAMRMLSLDVLARSMRTCPCIVTPVDMRRLGANVTAGRNDSTSLSSDAGFFDIGDPGSMLRASSPPKWLSDAKDFVACCCAEISTTSGARGRVRSWMEFLLCVECFRAYSFSIDRGKKIYGKVRRVSSAEGQRGVQSM